MEKGEIFVNQSKRYELLGQHLLEDSRRIKSAALALDVFDDGLNNEELLDRILLALGEDISGESTFSDKVKQMEEVFYPDDDNEESDTITYTGG